jgi:hypothetical protein
MSAGYPLYFLGQGPAAPGGAVVPGQEPGTIFIPGLGMQRITDWRDAIIYDMETLPAAIATGQQFQFFRNLAIAGVPKTLLQTNIVTPSALPSGHRAIICGIHIDCALNTVHDDVKAIMNAGYFEFITGNQKLEANGPVWSFPSPYGLNGYVSQDGLAAPRELSTINNGVPSMAAVGKMSIPIDLVNQLTFQGTLTFFQAVALTVPVNLYVTLRGWLQTPVR